MATLAQQHGIPLTHVDAESKVTYLKRVTLWTAGGLTFTAMVGLLTTAALFVAASVGMTFLFSPMVSFGCIMVCFGIAHWLAPTLVFGQQKVLGFAIACLFEGISFGWLLLSAFSMGLEAGNPFGLAGTALALTAATAVGLTGYVWSNPREFRLLGAALSALMPAMLLLMVGSFAASMLAPGLMGGVVGIGLTGLFVVISAAGLLYQINAVLHRLATNMHIEGAYLITMGVLVLYWNILSLLMSLNRD